MVKVYLPMGYPIQSGNQFENVIYQGSVARLYEIPKDPRSDAQLQNRRFLSDVTRVRGTMGAFGRAACKAALGSKWSTLLYQVIKADVESWWSNALAEWDGFGEQNQEAWRQASPYQLTFNDVGQIFFGVIRVLYKTLDFYAGYVWEMEEWIETESADALAWWQKVIEVGLPRGMYSVSWLGYVWDGTWTSVYSPGFWSDNYAVASGPVGKCFSAYWSGKTFTLWFAKGPTFGNLLVYMDGQLVRTIEQYQAGSVGQTFIEYECALRGLHYLELVKESADVTADAVKIN